MATMSRCAPCLVAHAGAIQRLQAAAAAIPAGLPLTDPSSICILTDMESELDAMLPFIRAHMASHSPEHLRQCDEPAGVAAVLAVLRVVGVPGLTEMYTFSDSGLTTEVGCPTLERTVDAY